MFISIPKEFFVPVLFSEDFSYNFQSDTMEYDTAVRSITSNISNRQKLADIDFINDIRQDGEFTTNYIENIKDKEIEEQLIDYIKGFMKFINELKNANCLGKSEDEIIKLINYYARGFRKLYDDYIKEISNVRRPLYTADIEGFIDHYIGRLEDLYNRNLAELNCENLDYDTIEMTIDEIVNDARNILKEEIRNINSNLVNRESSCKSYNNIEKAFMESDNIYNTIDNEFVQEMSK
ncbi:hypothetical protein ACQPUZ_05800 [Clostridium tertium]